MTPLYGHDAAVTAFRSGLASGRLHHAWLIAGPQGIGKALFAQKAALRVLAEGAGPPVDLPGHYAAGDVFAMPCRTRRGGLDVEGLGIVEAVDLRAAPGAGFEPAQRPAMVPQRAAIPLQSLPHRPPAPQSRRKER